MRRLISVLLSLVAGTHAMAQTVTMNIAYEDKEQPPYYMGSSGDVAATNPGVAVEMVMALSTMVPNLKINLSRAPWKRCITQLGANAYDGIFNASYSKERLAIGWYPTQNGAHDGPVDTSKRITTITYSMYVLKKSELKWDGEAFSNLNGAIGAPLGYSIVNDLKTLGAVVLEVPGTRNALGMVVKNRIVGAALQDVTADALIKEYPDEFSSLMKIEKPIISKPYYLMLSNGFVTEHPEVAKQIWAAIAKLRERDFAKLAAKYEE